MSIKYSQWIARYRNIREVYEDHTRLRGMLRECRDGFEVIWGCAIDKVVADIAERNIAKLTAELGDRSPESLAHQATAEAIAEEREGEK